MSDHEHDRRHQDVEVARLTVKVDALESKTSIIETDVKSLLALANQTKGGWAVILLVAGVAGTAGALVAKFAPFLGGLPK